MTQETLIKEHDKAMGTAIFINEALKDVSDSDERIDVIYNAISNHMMDDEYIALTDSVLGVLEAAKKIS